MKHDEGCVTFSMRLSAHRTPPSPSSVTTGQWPCSSALRGTKGQNPRSKKQDSNDCHCPEDASYHERVLQAPIPDRAAIREYWATKVAREQANITCKLVELYLDGNTGIAEWIAEFDDVVQGTRKRMKEIAVLDFRGRQICALREYWSSEQIGELVGEG